MTDAVQAVENMRRKIQDNWGWFLALGVALVIGGIILIAAPLATSVAVTILIAAVLFVGGLVQIYNSFKTHGTASFLWNLITGIIAVIGGIVIYEPARGNHRTDIGDCRNLRGAGHQPDPAGLQTEAA